MKGKSALAELWQRELDGMGRQYVRDREVYGDGRRAAASALEAGVSPQAVAEGLGLVEPEPDGLVVIATPADLARLLKGSAS